MSTPVVRFQPVEGDPGPEGLEEWERDRYGRLRSAAARRAYVGAHLLVRDVLVELAGPGLRVAQRCAGCGGEDHGAPYVVGRDDVFVSLSHSHHGERGWVAAMAARVPCGIDVQLVSRVPDRALTRAELADVGEDQVRRSQLWARKEAWIKAGAASLDHVGTLDVLGHRPGLMNWTGPASREVVGAWAALEESS